MNRQPVQLVGRRIVVIGLGQFGGGVGAVRFLVRHGAHVLVTDQQKASSLRASLDQLADPPNDKLTFRLGEHRKEDFTHADLIVANPAVRPNNPFLAAARGADVPITSEIRLLIERLPNRKRIIGVTGTAGKSTVTAMIGHILNKLRPNLSGAGKVWVGGNIGGSLLPQVEQISDEDWVVLELSSFMLYGLREDRWSPHIAVLTNLEPNHLDWHGDFEAYGAAKRTIVEFQDKNDWYAPGPGVEAQIRSCARMSPPLSLEAVAALDCVHLPGRYNLINAGLAAAACASAGADMLLAVKQLDDFGGLPHRLQWIAEHQGVRYFNDSKATTPQAAIQAMLSFPDECVHIILGGYDKQIDLTEMAQTAVRCCRAIYTVGQTGETIARVAESADPASKANPCEICRCQTLDQAVAQTATRVRSGDVVLLSPGCASWDQFEHFEKRGWAFVEAVLKFTGEGAPSPGG